jgi:hypothetical protein
MFGRQMRKFITTGIEILGAVFIGIGAFQLWTPAGLIVTGALLITAGALSA